MSYRQVLLCMRMNSCFGMLVDHLMFILFSIGTLELHFKLTSRLTKQDAYE
jgi:hypothetical protein